MAFIRNIETFDYLNFSYTSISFLKSSVIMRMISINAILCLFIVLIGIAVSSSSLIDNDEDAAAAAAADWNYFDSYYPAHLLKARAAKSRFWKRAPHRKFWKRSLNEPAMNNNDMADSAHSQFQQQEKH
ncbi:unnamed protein product [Rotaria sordida]|uniref:Uncharacterized protein n=2 Tax=Rotaria sordida TaxID=392033 RepID=A0A813V1F4_9BILA|nr:unnamed protein product [Rotaria sordida]CAF0830289.1 unnamed protein product [Rotaria sordida]CAF0855810.1 unnamed protein product [Rotaria sordida]CAF0948076.1 unnamed protein product [Rotaria sordida]